MTKSKKEIFIVPFERSYNDIKLDVNTLDNQMVFSDAFWNHFTSTFPSATIALFKRQDDEYDNVIKLSDSSYDYGLISSRNRIFFLNYLPKNLSKEEINSYRKGIGFFVVPDSTDANGQREPDITLERQWSKASKEVEQEYLHFFSFVNDFDNEYAVIAKRTFIDSILKRYK
jgi:hypothetical protein